MNFYKEPFYLDKILFMSCCYPSTCIISNQSGISSTLKCNLWSKLIWSYVRRRTKRFCVVYLTWLSTVNQYIGVNNLKCPFPLFYT